MRKILIVEDDTLLNRTLGYNLASDGYEITAAYNHKDAVFHLKETEFDVALLDINLPDGSGLDLCEEIRGRGQHTYIIFITANDKESDMLKGYEAGGADYVTKPFSVTVLCRKVAAVFANLELRTPRHDLFDDGFLKIDFSEQRASLAGEPLDFTPKEYRTLFLFVKNPRIILTKRQILEKLWDIDGDFVDEHTLTTIISRIRKKIETDEHKYIKTAYGMGYQWIGGDQNENRKPVHEKVSVAYYWWPSGNLFSGAALSVFGHEKPTGGFVRRVADRCVSGMGRDFPALLSKEADPVHR